VVDLGCAAGDQAQLLARRGARVLGLDANEELLAHARARGIPRAEFSAADLRALPDLGAPADGLWSSFAAAYFVDLAPVLARWGRLLRPGGWIALVEVADMFGHEPLAPRTRELFAGYAADARRAGRYDFDMGARLGAELARAGFEPARSLALPDQELAGDGPAPPEALAAWSLRFERMGLLRAFCGAEFERVRDDFLGCLARPDHRATASVQACVAIKPDSPPARDPPAPGRR